MKKLILTTFALVLALSAQAQVNTDVNKTTTTQRVVEKDTDVKTKIVQGTEVEMNVLQVEGNQKEDQATKVVTNSTSAVEVVKDDVSIDAANNQKRIDNMKRQQMELEASKQAALQKAEMKKQQLEAQAKQRQAEMEARRAALETRPKGMARLKRD